MQATQEIETEAQPTVSMLGGIMITAGTAVGAGMFSLPTVSAGMWFGWSVVCMLFSWFCLYQVSMMILEVNLNFKRGDSFNTMVKATLGPTWNVINGLLFAFLLYILDYAYISGGGSIVNQTLQSSFGFAPPQMISGMVFALLFAFVVWLNTKAVDRVVTVLMVGMVLTFLMAVGNLTLMADMSNLVNGGDAESGSYVPFIFAALPFYLTSFGFHCNVPSLVKYYGKQPKLIARSMLIGSTLCFVIYLLWLLSTMGNLKQADFLPVIAQGGNIGALVNAIGDVASGEKLADVLAMFANLAIISSFLGVSLALFDFIADKFGFDDSAMGRLKTALIAFIPPTLGGVLFPDGFISAIGFAGLVLAVNALIIPPLMVKKSREMFPASEFRQQGGNTMVYLMIACGTLYAVCHILSMLGLLPVFA
ncbi:MAG: tryptophan-specific transport protein [Phenylobacterium sp.]|jgi:tryptophan-specific transport protein